jgi:hypothetical protein
MQSLNEVYYRPLSFGNGAARTGATSSPLDATRLITDRGRETVHWRSVNGGKSWREA